MKEIKNIKDINTELVEGNLLFNAIILLSTTTHSDKTVEEIIEELKNL